MQLKREGLKRLNFLFSQLGAFFADLSWVIILMNGMMNSLTLLMFGQTVTHHTGNLTKLAQSITTGDFRGGLLFLLMIGLYWLGVVLSGLLFPAKNGNKRRESALEIIGLGLVMALFALFFKRDMVMIYPLALISGAQNGMNVYYRDVLLRFTHMTGCLTDMGLAFSNSLLKDRVAMKRLAVMSISLLVFLLGALLGAVLYTLNCALVFFWLGLAQVALGFAYSFTGEGARHAGPKSLPDPESP